MIYKSKSSSNIKKCLVGKLTLVLFQLLSSVINDIATEEELEHVIDLTEINNDSGLSENTNTTSIAEGFRENIDFSDNVNSASIVLTCFVCEKGDGDIYHCIE